jgi:hypothetical protein
MIRWLRKVEAALQNAIESGSALKPADVEPLDIARQIQREVERNRRVFINDQVYVAHKMIIHLYAPSPSKVEEYEALFNNAEFHKYLEEYIKARGYRLLDRIRISIQCHPDALPEFRSRECFVEFSWPQVSSDPGEVTVVLDDQDENRILAVNAPDREGIPDAWLETVQGTSYQVVNRIGRREFNVGRGENVVHARSGKVLRINHLAFTPPRPGESVNQSVSRQHARIVARGGVFFLYDTGSQNGTRIERGRSVLLVPRSRAAGDGVELQNGDVLTLGQARLVFHVGLPPKENP